MDLLASHLMGVFMAGAPPAHVVDAVERAAESAGVEPRDIVLQAFLRAVNDYDGERGRAA